MAGAATQIYSSDFDRDFYKLPADTQARIQRKMDDVGRRLESYPHYQMTGSTAFRLRVGNYRVIYRFDPRKSEMYLAAIGHRREIYRDR
jgi:mRNA interferase RelE/StbE